MISLGFLGIVTAFAAGMVSFLSPCVLPLVPGYVSFAAGQSLRSTDGGRPSSRLRTLGMSLCFVLGFSTVFVLLGLGANALSTHLRVYRVEAGIAGGALVILFGLITTGLVRWTWLARDLRWHGSLPGGGSLAAYLLGVAFAFGWTPCIGPVLGAVLTVTASSQASGALLLAAYSLGLGLPFVLAAVFMGDFVSRLRTFRRVGKVLQVTAGSVMVAMGLAMVTGHLTSFAYFLLEVFPALGRIG